MIAERGLSLDLSTIHGWILGFSPLILNRFNRRKRAVTGKSTADETRIKVRGRRMYPYRAIDSVADTVDFWFGQLRALAAARRTGKPSFPAISSGWPERRRLHPRPTHIRQSRHL
ncbi:DDE-type integrase/transposase/recombinase [Peteryoungia desertarenae]